MLLFVTECERKETEKGPNVCSPWRLQRPKVVPHRAGECAKHDDDEQQRAHESTVCTGKEGNHNMVVAKTAQKRLLINEDIVSFWHHLDSSE